MSEHTLEYWKAKAQAAEIALANETERCAKIAEADVRTALAKEYNHQPRWFQHALTIAAEIRAGKRQHDTR